MNTLRAMKNEKKKKKKPLKNYDEQNTLFLIQVI